MRKSILAACLLSATAFSAAAQNADGAHSPRGLRVFLGGGLSTGGDTLLRVQNVAQGARANDVTPIRAGDGLDLRVGLSMRLGDLPWSLQAVAAYHNDQTNDDESKYRFRRLPVEATLLWHATDRARIGFGVRKALQPKVKISNGRSTDANGNPITGINRSYDMKASTGLIIEGEYAVTPNWSLKGRYVYETYRYKDFPEEDKAKGDHVALQSVWYLN